MDKKTISVNPENFETNKKGFLQLAIFVAIQVKLKINFVGIS